MQVKPQDQILVNELSLHIPLGASTWPKPNAATSSQPVLVSLRVPFSLFEAGASDELSYSLNYSSLAKTAQAAAERSQPFESMEALAHGICSAVLQQYESTEEVWVRVEKKKGLLLATGVAVEVREIRKGSPGCTLGDLIFVRDLELMTIIGIHPWERREKQIVRINLKMELIKREGDQPDLHSGFDYRGLTAEVSDHILNSSYQTVESLATSIAEKALSCSPSSSIRQVAVKVAKPSALLFAESAEVEVTRSKDDFATRSSDESMRDTVNDIHVAALALGSNLGDRVGNIENALRNLEKHDVIVMDTSFLYETKAMYVEEQPHFVNGACLIKTTLDPVHLLNLLKDTEALVGRTETFRNGPRVVDLDIILYDDIEFNNTPRTDRPKHELDLIIPHPKMHEREFVLRPLSDIVPSAVHPSLNLPISTLLSTLLRSHPPSNPMRKVLSFPRASGIANPVVYALSTQTYLMATLNATPDSFSDGSLHNTIPSALEYARSAVQAGADIIDVGGYSTRPGAEFVSSEEEIGRIVPVIQAVRQEKIAVPISVDTFRADVARAALLSGANCINDVYALSGEGMIDLVRTTGVPVIMMHSRGDAGKNKDYGPKGIVEVAREELGEKVRNALESGIRRWNIVVDPGIGFSKTVEDNVRMIRAISKFTAPYTGTRSLVSKDLRRLTPSHLESSTSALDNLPILVGTSRKSFLGTLINRPQGDPKDRGWATAAVVSAAVQQGAHFLRVHDVSEMGDVVKVADAIWRPSP